MKTETRTKLGLKKREQQPKQPKTSMLAVDLGCLARELHAIASREAGASADGPLRARELDGASAAALAAKYGVSDPLALAALARRKAEQPTRIDPRVQARLDVVDEEQRRREAEVAKLKPFDARKASADEKRARWAAYGVSTAAGPLGGGVLGPTEEPSWHSRVRDEMPAEAHRRKEARRQERAVARVRAKLSAGRALDWRALAPRERAAYRAIMQEKHGLAPNAPTSYSAGGAAPAPRPPRK